MQESMSGQVSGAKEMFNQSIVYLLHEYMDAGLTEQDARERVSIDIRNIYNEHVEAGKVNPVKSSIYNPAQLVDKVLMDTRTLKKYRIHKEEQFQFKHRLDTIIRNLQQLKVLIK